MVHDPAERRRLLADIRPLRESPAFRRIWAGGALSAIGSRMTTFAVALQVYELTRSSAAVGALGLTFAVPALTIGLVGGSLADAVDRRRLVLVTSSCLALVSAGFAAQALLDLRQVWLLYVLAVVQSAFQAVDGPARRAFLPRLVRPERVPAAVALNQLSMHSTGIIGPAAAGLVTAAAGLRFCYVVDVVSFAAAIYGLARLPGLPPTGGSPTKPGLRAVGEGMRFIANHRLLAVAFLADLDATVLGMPIALFPAINAAHFGGSAQTLGLLTAGPAIGGMLGSVFSGPVSHVRRQGRAMLVTVALWGAAIAAFGFIDILWLAVVLLALAGAADTTSVVFRGTIVQLATPDEFRGRVSGVDYVVGGGGPQFGNFEAGIVASLTTPAISAVSGGLATVLGAAVLHLAVPAFARYDVRAPAPSAQVG